MQHCVQSVHFLTCVLGALVTTDANFRLRGRSSLPDDLATTGAAADSVSRGHIGAWDAPQHGCGTCLPGQKPTVAVCRDDGAIRYSDWGDASAFPLQVAAGRSLAVRLCNVGNAVVDGALIFTDAPSPIVGSVGRGAHIRIDVLNSWNVAVSGVLSISGVVWETDDPHGHHGHKHHEAMGAMGHGKNRVTKEKLRLSPPSLVPTLVSGPFGDNVDVRVSMKQSANVLFQSPLSSLQVTGGAFCGTLVGATGSSLEHSYVEVEFADSGNVAGSSSSGQVSIESGTLIGRMLQSESIVGSTVLIHVTNASNIDARQLKVQGGSVMGSPIHTRQISKHAVVRLRLQHVGNFRGDELVVHHGEVIDEMVGCEGNVVDSAVAISATDVANAHVAVARILGGELVDEVIDTVDITGSRLEVTLKDLANVNASQLVNVAGELLDEVIDGEDVVNSEVVVDEERVGNVRAHQLVVSDTSLVDETIDAREARNSKFFVRLRSMASFQGDLLDISAGGTLHDEAVDVDRSGGGNFVSVSVAHVGNATGTVVGKISGDRLVEGMGPDDDVNIRRV